MSIRKSGVGIPTGAKIDFLRVFMCMLVSF